MEKVKIELESPIKAHDSEVKSIEFRRPIGKDIRNHGFPYAMDDRGNLAFDSRAIAKYIEVLAGIPPSSVDQMAPVDFQKCMGEIIGFFGNAQKT